MLTRHNYAAMTVTGSLHIVISIGLIVISILGLTEGYFLLHYHFIGAIIIGAYVGLVGCLGIAAGVKKLEDGTIRNLKIAYMVTAILSAVIASLIGFWLYATSLAVGLHEYVYNGILYGTFDVHNYATYGGAGMGITFLEFVLAIVSSSICCCCSPTTHDTTIIVQAPPPQVVTTVPGQHPAYNMSQYPAQTPQTMTTVPGQQPAYHMSGFPAQQPAHHMSGFPAQQPAHHMSGFPAQTNYGYKQ